MKLFMSTRAACLAVIFAFAAGAFAHGQSEIRLDKHARKIHHKLARYPSGQYLHLVMRDASDSYGALGTLSGASFTFTNADSNTISTFFYSDVDRVRTDKQPIGEGMESRRHIRHLVPIVASVAAVGAAGAIYAAER